MELTIELKQQVHAACLAFVEARLDREQRGLREAQEAANEDTKSSAGDKYETGRARAHLDQEKFSRMIVETVDLRARLVQIDPTKICDRAVPGAAVLTNRGGFYCAISADEIEFDRVEFCPISLASPIGLAMAGKSAGESVSFRGVSYVIESIL